jgi:putative ABC transport system permease protein
MEIWRAMNGAAEFKPLHPSGWTGLPSRIRRSVVLGFKSLWLHRLRSLLTVLGIVFGVCSVIAMLAVGEGASYEAQEQIRRLGSRNIILRAVPPLEQDRASQGRSRILEYGLTYEDMENIRLSIPGVQVILPSRILRMEAWVGRHYIDATIAGTVQTYPHLKQLPIIEGRYFSDEEMASYANVCVLSADVVPKLFPLDKPVGMSVRLGTDYYRVVGVMEPEALPPAGAGGSGAAADQPLPDIYIPLTAAKHRFGEILVKRTSGSFEASRVELHEAVVQVANQDDVEDTAKIIQQILARDRKKTDYKVIVPLELLRQAERTKQIFNIVLGAIAGISLLVGGIGIMNIMLASVTERTREIGIRRALGARKRDIILQFLIETVILSGSGGVLGVALGVLIPLVISTFAEMRTIVTPGAPVLAFTISALVGVIFGIYPAVRAANMDPVQALRHE